MGRTEFTRTITTTTVKASVVAMKEGKVITTPCEVFEVDGNVDEDKALNLTKAKYGKKQQYVIELSKCEDVYTISIEDLKKYGKKVEPKTEEAKAQPTA